MKLSFHQFWLFLAISIVLVFPSMIKAGSVSSDTSIDAKKTTDESLPLKQKKAQHLTPEVKSNYGYCCKKGKVSKSKKKICQQNKGNFSFKQSDAKKKCAIKRGFCCSNAKVSAISKSNCAEKRGRYFNKKRDASIFCRKQPGYCCSGGKLSNVTQKTCKKKNGKFSFNQQLVARACKAKNGFCCTNKKVSKSSRELCKQKKGKFSANRQKINRICFAGKNKQPTSPKIIRQKPIATSDSLALPIKQAPSDLPKISSDLGKSRQSLGSAGKDISRGNDLGKRRPAGTSTPANNVGSGYASEYAEGVGDKKTRVGKATDTFSEHLQPRLATGSGAHRQNNDPDETDSKHMGSKKSASDTLTDEEQARILRAGARASPPFGPTPEYLMALERAKIKAEKEEAKKNQERTVDSGPGDDGSEGVVDPDRIKRTSAGHSGIRYAPGEEATDEGTINYGRLDEIQSQKNQIRTFDGNVLDSRSYEDLSEQVQKRIKAGGEATRSD